MPPSAGPPSRDPQRRSADEPTGGIRLNRFFTEQGLCSRREADRLIEQGRVTVNGRPAVLGDRVQPGDRIAKDGAVVPWGNAPLYLKCHKPVGITTTSEPHVPGNLIAFIGHSQRIFPIGRLDKDSSGLILLTNDGSIVNKILRAENHHEKEYVVEVDRPFDDRFLGDMARGVVILGSRTRPARTRRAGPRTFHIVLTEGRNRQIRRMCQALGYRVIGLKRIRIMHITLADLAPGAWRELTDRERDALLEALKEDGKR
jgi:23S rRNA pseudouridine2604 synthase